MKESAFGSGNLKMASSMAIPLPHLALARDGHGNVVGDDLSLSQSEDSCLREIWDMSVRSLDRSHVANSIDVLKLGRKVLWVDRDPAGSPSPTFGASACGGR